MMSILLRCIKIVSATLTDISIDYVDLVTREIAAIVCNLSVQVPKVKKKKAKAATTTQIISDPCFSDHSDFATSCIVVYYSLEIKSWRFESKKKL